jgi:thioesterase domain-containing protein
MAQQIESLGMGVALLAMIDPAPPGERGSSLDDISLLAGFASVADLSAEEIDWESWKGLSIEAGIDRMIEVGRVRGLLPSNIDQLWLRKRFDLFSRNVKALHKYEARPYQGRVTLLRATGSLRAAATDPTCGWGALATTQVHLIEADHLSILRQPALAELVECLKKEFDTD